MSSSQVHLRILQIKPLPFVIFVSGVCVCVVYYGKTVKVHTAKSQKASLSRCECCRNKQCPK